MNWFFFSERYIQTLIYRDKIHSYREQSIQYLKKDKKINKKSKNKLDCPPDKIINPKTGRCVKKTGKIGKEILRRIRSPTIEI